MTKPPISHWLVRRTYFNGTAEYLTDDDGFKDRESAYTFSYRKSARDAADQWPGSKVIAVRKKPGLRARLKAYVKRVHEMIDANPGDTYLHEVAETIWQIDRPSGDTLLEHWFKK